VKDTPEAGGEIDAPVFELMIREYGHYFLVNLSNYLDTGLFLDHRDTRKWVEEMVRERAAVNPDFQVLNLFAYTGSFSVYAAAGGASMTHTVDLSKTYCDWARRNLELNHFAKEQHWIYRMDTFEFYKYAGRKNLKFDFIILDPPTFSRNKGNNFGVQRDHYDLVRGSMAMLRDGGELLFSNNCLDFVLDFRIKRDFEVHNVQNLTVPIDFRVDKEAAEDDLYRQIHNSFLIRRKSS
jgi:23S rRNA (cytosine1962-C5)-methyltransferase